MRDTMSRTALEQLRRLEMTYETQSEVIRRLNRMINCLPGIIGWKDLNSCYLGQNIVSASSFIYHGLNAMEESNFIVGKMPEDLYGNETAQQTYKEDEIVKTQNRTHTILRSHQLSNGKGHPILIRKSPLHDASGNPVGIMTSATNLTLQSDLSIICDGKHIVTPE